MCDGVLISSVCTVSISDGVCLFQGQEPGQEQGGEQGRGTEALQPPLQPLQLLQPLQPPDRAASSVVRDPGAMANPPAAAGIFLFSPNL